MEKIENNIENKSIKELESLYELQLRKINTSRQQLLSSVKIPLSSDYNFSDKLYEALKNDKIKELEEKLKNNEIEYQEIKATLEQKKKELIQNFNRDSIPLDQISKLQNFLEKFEKENNGEKNNERYINLSLGKKPDLNPNLDSLELSTKLLNVLKSESIYTLNDLLDAYQREGIDYFSEMRGMGKRTISDLTGFLEKHGCII